MCRNNQFTTIIFLPIVHRYDSSLDMAYSLCFWKNDKNDKILRMFHMMNDCRLSMECLTLNVCQIWANQVMKWRFGFLMANFLTTSISKIMIICFMHHMVQSVLVLRKKSPDPTITHVTLTWSLYHHHFTCTRIITLCRSTDKVTDRSQWNMQT